MDRLYLSELGTESEMAEQGEKPYVARLAALSGRARVTTSNCYELSAVAYTALCFPVICIHDIVFLHVICMQNVVFFYVTSLHQRRKRCVLKCDLYAAHCVLKCDFW